MVRHIMVLAAMAAIGSSACDKAPVRHEAQLTSMPEKGYKLDLCQVFTGMAVNGDHDAKSVAKSINCNN